MGVSPNWRTVNGTWALKFSRRLLLFALILIVVRVPFAGWPDIRVQREPPVFFSLSESDYARYARYDAACPLLIPSSLANLAESAVEMKSKNMMGTQQKVCL